MRERTILPTRKPIELWMQCRYLSTAGVPVDAWKYNDRFRYYDGGDHFLLAFFRHLDQSHADRDMLQVGLVESIAEGKISHASREWHFTTLYDGLSPTDLIRWTLQDKPEVGEKWGECQLFDPDGQSLGILIRLTRRP